jgi:hypothetical protein
MKPRKTRQELVELVRSEIASILGFNWGFPASIEAHPPDEQGRTWDLVGVVSTSVHRKAIDKVRHIYDFLPTVSPEQ